jgi:hypothetical protein
MVREMNFPIKAKSIKVPANTTKVVIGASASSAWTELVEVPVTYPRMPAAQSPAISGKHKPVRGDGFRYL